MICTKSDQDNAVVIKLEGDLFISDVAALREELLSGLTSSDKVIMDLSNVGEIDTAGIQLLLAAVRSASAAGKGVYLENNTSAINSAALRVGLDPVELSGTPSGGR